MQRLYTSGDKRFRGRFTMTQLSVGSLWTIYQARHQGVRLDLKGAVVRPDSPLWLALRGIFPSRHARVETVAMQRKERERTISGFIQARWRTGQPVLDLVYIAPSLESQPGAAWLWQSLLHELVRVTGAQGGQRLFTHLSENRHGEVEVMRQAGFSLYCQDRLYRLKTPLMLGRSQPHFWQPRCDQDEWGLMRLYNSITPAVVQQAESWGHNGNGSQSYTTLWGGSRHRTHVLRGTSAGEIMGFLRITPGERGHWLKIVLHPDVSHQADALLKEALGFLQQLPRRPIYCDVREYEGYLTGSLERADFDRLMARLLLVRHITVAVREVVRRPIPALDVETAPTVFTSIQACAYHSGPEEL
jgi:hypothetical protein